MATAEQARLLLARHGIVQPQPPSDWTGPFALPQAVERFYREVGPVDLFIRSYGNGFSLPGLARLWPHQAGYRWNGLTGEPVADWQDDWLVVADQGGDPFILSQSSGVVLHDVHGRGVWEPGELFPDLNTMAACLGQLGAVVASAGQDFTDEDCRIRPEWRDMALAGLRLLISSPTSAESVLSALDWG
jgi:hypothetical protein